MNALLSKNHKHGPCKQKPCGKTLKPDGRCSKHFPKPWREADTLGPNGSPEYKRRDAAHGGNDMNSMLVAYNWVLSWRYRCHLNVEICSSISSVKYLYKYVCKGHDRVAAVVQSVAGDDDVDEIRNFLDARYLGASEAVYRIFKFDLSDKFPAVERLAVHLPDEQQVYFDPGDVKAAQRAVSSLTSKRQTKLTAWFTANQ